MGEDVTVLCITGKRLGPFALPKRWREDSELAVEAVEAGMRAADPERRLTFAARPWARHAVTALSKGGWLPPVVIVGGKVRSQGATPAQGPLLSALQDLLRHKDGSSDDAAGDDPFDYSRFIGVEDFDCRR